ncbi:MAG: nucleoside-diphosphate kinase [Candidatus Thorarchaeota archaeon]
MERSLVIIKPDGAVRRRVGALVVEALLNRGYDIKAFKEMKVSESLAKMHYDVHKEKPFFPWLVDFISSGRVLVMIFESEGVIQGVRDALGATFVQKAEPDTLRGRYGIWAGVNIAHASDAPETATKEIALWTGEGGVAESDDATASAQAYIQKYTAGDADYTMKIREVVKTSIESKDTSPKVLESLETLLSKDAEGVGADEIKALAKAIFDFIIEEVEKE